MFSVIGGGSTQVNKQYADRFIPLRKIHHLGETPTRNCFSQPSDAHEDNDEAAVPPPFNKFSALESSTFFNFSRVCHSRANYENLLKEVWFPHRSNKVLQFGNAGRNEKPNRAAASSRRAEPLHHTWPTKVPQRRPIIGAPIIMLDMPNFDYHICHNVIDWSSTGTIASIHNNEVYMWHCSSTMQRFSTSSEQRVAGCIKWSPNGRLLAMSLYPASIGIWSINTRKITKRIRCCDNCNVNAIIWLCRHRIVWGCSRGTLFMCDLSEPQKRHTMPAHSNEIINIQKSCNGTFIASSGLDDFVRVWRLPTFKLHVQIECHSPVKAIAWHPWKESILAVGDIGSGLTIVVVSQKDKIHYLDKLDCGELERETVVDCLTFNPVSGELVVGFSTTCSPLDGGIVPSIVVFGGSLRQKVEEIYYQTGRLTYLLWGDGGRVLGAASTEEILCVYNFFNTTTNQLFLNQPVKSKSKNSGSKLLNPRLR